MKDKNAKIKSSARLTAVLSALFFLLSAVTVSYAWFRFGATSGKTHIGTGGDAAVTLQMAVWTPDSSGNAAAEEKGSYVWGEEIFLEEDSASTPLFGAEYAGETPPLQFGNIDNLSYLHKSNVVWFCLKVKAAEGRSYGDLKISFGETPYVFFPNVDMDSASAEMDMEAVKKGIDPYLEELLQYGCAASYAAPVAFDAPVNPQKEDGTAESYYPITPIGAAESYKLSISDYNFVKKEKSPSGDDSASDSSSEESDKNFSGIASVPENGEYYYLYFRCAPNLERYAYLSEAISEYMPCVLQFSLRVKASIDNREVFV